MHAHTRVESSLETRRLYLTPVELSRVTCLSADLADERLGLKNERSWEGLSATTSLVIHAAWSVNFVGRLEGFVPHIKGEWGKALSKGLLTDADDRSISQESLFLIMILPVPSPCFFTCLQDFAT